MEQITNFLSSLTPTQWIIAIVVVVMLAKKLVKLAIVIGLIIFVVFPYIKSTGALNIDVDTSGILQQVLKQLGL